MIVMEVIFKDDSKENLLFWVDDKNNIIIAKDLDEDFVEGIQINDDASKRAVNFFKQV